MSPICDYFRIADDSPSADLTSRGGGVQRSWFRALDYQPQHECYLTEEGRLRVGIHLVLILRQQNAGKAQNHPGGAGEGKPDAQETRQEARPVYQRGEREKPQTPKHF